VQYQEADEGRRGRATTSMTMGTAARAAEDQRVRQSPSSSRRRRCRTRRYYGSHSPTARPAAEIDRSSEPLFFAYPFFLSCRCCMVCEKTSEIVTCFRSHLLVAGTVPCLCEATTDTATPEP
jgi:hypothetical protein